MEKKGRVELIDFASALHNREVKEALKVNTMRQTGVSTYESYGRSKVLGTTIEEDMVIIDLRYPMVGVTQEGGESIKKEGSVDLRLFLLKRDRVGRVRTQKTVADSLRDHYGFLVQTLREKVKGHLLEHFRLKKTPLFFT